MLPEEPSRKSRGMEGIGEGRRPAVHVRASLVGSERQVPAKHPATRRKPRVSSPKGRSSGRLIPFGDARRAGSTRYIPVQSFRRANLVERMKTRRRVIGAGEVVLKTTRYSSPLTVIFHESDRYSV